RVHGIEEHAGLNLTPGITPDFHGVALSWSRGMSLNGLLRRIDLAEGDLLMLLNQTIDLLQQVQSAVGQVLDAPGIWAQNFPALTDEAPDKQSQGLVPARGTSTPPNVLVSLAGTRGQHERLTRLRPLLAQASSSLLRGIVMQSR